MDIMCLHFLRYYNGLVFPFLRRGNSADCVVELVQTFYYCAICDQAGQALTVQRSLNYMVRSMAQDIDDVLNADYNPTTSEDIDLFKEKK